jgi:hypothetical protein
MREQHALAAPQLLIDGQPSPRDLIRRAPIDGRRVSVTNATQSSLQLDGQPSVTVEPDELGLRLAELRESHARIRLVNERADGAEAVRDYVIRVLVPEVDALTAVDAAFATTIGADPTPRDLDLFADAVRKSGTARPYGSALHGFVLALLVKDEQISGSGLEFATYRDRMSAALEEFAHYPDEPLARAAAGVIRFNLNVLEPGMWHSGIRELDRCVDDLRSVIRGSSRSLSTANEGRHETRACPVDKTTHTLLQLHADLDSSSRAKGAALALMRLADAPRTTKADAAKARALSLFVRADPPTREQLRAARALRHDPLFGRFAAGLL